MYSMLTLIGIVDATLFGFFAGLGLWLINRVMNRCFG